MTKTYKLFIDGAFPRTESGRSFKVMDKNDKRVVAHLCQGSRKDLRGAVEAARKALGGWAARDAYNRAQILYRMGEMLEGKADEFAAALADTIPGGKRRATKEVVAAIDRLVHYAGWADKFSQVLGCHNPVGGPYYNFTVPEPTGVVGVVVPDDPPLLGLVSLIAPAICAGNTVIVVASETHPLTASIFGEVCATSDVPAGVINILTGFHDELIPHLAEHRDINAIHAANVDETHAVTLREGASDNVKRVTVRDLDPEDWYDAETCHSPWWIEPFVEHKTIWHPSGI